MMLATASAARQGVRVVKAAAAAGGGRRRQFHWPPASSGTGQALRRPSDRGAHGDLLAGRAEISATKKVDISDDPEAIRRHHERMNQDAKRQQQVQSENDKQRKREAEQLAKKLDRKEDELKKRAAAQKMLQDATRAESSFGT